MSTKQDKGRFIVSNEKQTDALRAALIEGEQSGLSEPFNLKEFLKEVKNERVLRR
jgi:Arc/MetJ-type ribon-helix-helix transcriptional regulator